ncbi:MAG: thioredoxin [Candidatus Thermoplasmatota archaeon]|jgi:thioredoxin 1|nr:thioredoxin [Candidatus Thermoplasmatota archaeon]MCL5984255.1 thioredoxin [Candidatus Thermoplasmatota archaeon]
MTVSDLSNGEFDKFSQDNRVALVDVWAPWCGPCRMVSPVVERLAQKYSGKVAFGKLNSDENMEIAQKLGIMSIPTLLIYKDGKLVDRIVGAYPQEIIEEHLSKFL